MSPLGASAAIALALVASLSAGAEEPDGPATAVDDGRRTLGRLLPNLGRGALGVFSGDNLGPLVVGTMATSFAAIYDDDVRDAVSDPDNDFGTILGEGTDPAVVAAVVGGAFVGGRLVENPRFRAMSYDLLDAVVVTWAYTSVLKRAVGRERPNGQNDKSFPSGHSSNAFALATVAERHYGWKVGVPAYALASAVAVSRLQRDKHYLSDVVAGAAIGYIVGRTVVRVNSEPLGQRGGATVSVTPLLGRQTRGLMVAVVF
jgi:hypothetical protein